MSPSGGNESADAAVRVGSRGSAERPFPDRGSASRDVGRRSVASTAVQHRRARRSLIRRPF